MRRWMHRCRARNPQEGAKLSQRHPIALCHPVALFHDRREVNILLPPSEDLPRERLSDPKGKVKCHNMPC
eukprot:727648-Pyramimonas_sp.AAC.1